MIKMIGLLKRRPGMSFEDFVDYYENGHAVLGRKVLQKVARYQRRFIRPMPGLIDNGSETFDCITEIWFDDQAAMDAAMGRLNEPSTAAMLREDEAKLFDCAKSVIYLVEDECTSDMGVAA